MALLSDSIRPTEPFQLGEPPHRIKVRVERDLVSEEDLEDVSLCQSPQQMNTTADPVIVGELYSRFNTEEDKYLSNMFDDDDIRHRRMLEKSELMEQNGQADKIVEQGPDTTADLSKLKELRKSALSYRDHHELAKSETEEERILKADYDSRVSQMRSAIDERERLLEQELDEREKLRYLRQYEKSMSEEKLIEEAKQREVARLKAVKERQELEKEQMQEVLTHSLPTREAPSPEARPEVEARPSVPSNRRSESCRKVESTLDRVQRTSYEASNGIRLPKTVENSRSMSEIGDSSQTNLNLSENCNASERSDSRLANKEWKTTPRGMSTGKSDITSGSEKRALSSRIKESPDRLIKHNRNSLVKEKLERQENVKSDTLSPRTAKSATKIVSLDNKLEMQASKSESSMRSSRTSIGRSSSLNASSRLERMKQKDVLSQERTLSRGKISTLYSSNTKQKSRNDEIQVSMNRQRLSHDKSGQTSEEQNQGNGSIDERGNDLQRRIEAARLEIVKEKKELNEKTNQKEDSKIGKHKTPRTSKQSVSPKLMEQSKEIEHRELQSPRETIVESHLREKQAAVNESHAKSSNERNGSGLEFPEADRPPKRASSIERHFKHAQLELLNEVAELESSESVQSPRSVDMLNVRKGENALPSSSSERKQASSEISTGNCKNVATRSYETVEKNYQTIHKIEVNVESPETMCIPNSPNKPKNINQQTNEIIRQQERLPAQENAQKLETEAKRRAQLVKERLAERLESKKKEEREHAIDLEKEAREIPFSDSHGRSTRNVVNSRESCKIDMNSPTTRSRSKIKGDYLIRWLDALVNNEKIIAITTISTGRTVYKNVPRLEYERLKGFENAEVVRKIAKIG